MPRSSNPADIYRDLKTDIKDRDSHSAKINEQKVRLESLALDWHASGEIAEQQRDEILYMVEKASFEDWHPLLYIIPYEEVKGRLITVPPQKRANPMEPEYIIEDLERSEFDIIEF